MGGLDILVNNAGIAGPTALCEDVDIEDWQRTINVDLNAQFYCAKYAIPMLKASGGGSIVMMASNAALFGFPMRSPYTAAKWALIGLTKSSLRTFVRADDVAAMALFLVSAAGAKISGQSIGVDGHTESLAQL